MDEITAGFCKRFGVMVMNFAFFAATTRGDGPVRARSSSSRLCFGQQ